jgi:hypothetical protein
MDPRSSYANVAGRDHSLIRGAIAFLRKPFNDEFLIVTLGDALRRQVGGVKRKIIQTRSNQ